MTVIALVALTYSAVISLATVLVYSTLKWYRSRYGWHLMNTRFVLSAVLIVATIRAHLGGADSVWFQTFRLVVFLGVPFFLTIDFLFILRAKREARMIIKEYERKKMSEDRAASEPVPERHQDRSPRPEDGTQQDLQQYPSSVAEVTNDERS